jgi:SAM-dependent methyltransferase
MKRPRPPAGPYRADLAYIHDAGFGSFAEAAAVELTGLLQAAQVTRGRIVELGCGSGIQAERMASAGYDVTGFDISPDMVALARRRVPRATFRCASFLDVEIPACVAVTAVGEIFNYLFDRRNSPARLKGLFRRVRDALPRGGLFLFDVATVGRVPGLRAKNHTEGADWACLYEAEEDPRTRTLTRRISTFRRAGEQYQRSNEVHRLRLYEKRELLQPLRELGFRVRTLAGYARLKFPPGYVGFAAVKR